MKTATPYLLNNFFNKTSHSTLTKNIISNKNCFNYLRKCSSTIQSISHFISELLWIKAKNTKQSVKNYLEIISVMLYLPNKLVWLKSDNLNGKPTIISKFMLLRKTKKYMPSTNMMSSESVLDLLWDQTIH